MVSINKSSSDGDVVMSFVDQQRINDFAKLNSKWEDLMEEVKVKKNEMRNIEDACNELEFSDDEVVRCHFGDIFLHQSVEDCQESVAMIKNKFAADIKLTEEKIIVLQEQMLELKTLLYATFGNKINLEAGK